MAKGPIVTPQVEALIASVYQRYSKKWKAREVRNEVSFILHKSNPKLPPGWPSLSTVQKVLATVRRKMKETPIDPQDKPWSMATLDEHPIPSEVTPAVLKVWKLRTALEQGFTIREAKWAARLSALIINPQKLSGIISQYARLELIYQIIERPFNSTPLDGVVMGIPIIEIVSGDGSDALWAALAKREDGVDQMRDLRQGKRKEITLHDPEFYEMTEEQTVATINRLSKKGLKIITKWENYKKEVRSERLNKATQ